MMLFNVPQHSNHSPLVHTTRQPTPPSYLYTVFPLHYVLNTYAILFGTKFQRLDSTAFIQH